MNTQESPSKPKAPTARTWSSWLDGRTLAILGALLTLGAMMQTSHSRLAAGIEKVRDDLGADIEKVRDDLSADIRSVDDRLRAVEIDVAAIRTVVIGLDARTEAGKQQSHHLGSAESGEREG